MSRHETVTPLPAHAVVPIDSVHESPAHPRTISQTAVDRVARSLRRFGWKQPIVADEHGEIVVGHTRHRAAVKLGLTEVPVVYAADLTAAELAAYRIEDNRSGEFTDWDLDRLAGEVEELERLDASLVDLLDVDNWAELAAYFDLPEDEGERSSHVPEYTKATNVPQYEPTGETPETVDLYDSAKADRLRARIAAAGLPDDVRVFLDAAAGRHIVFNYRKIAEFYANAPADVQALMEESALVIIDVGDAIRHGYTRFRDALAELRDADAAAAEEPEVGDDGL